MTGILSVSSSRVEAFVGFDEDEGDLEALQLIDDGAANLAVAADDEVVVQTINVDFIDHGSPGLHAVTAENGEQDALGDPDLQRENSRINEHREDLGGLVDGAEFDGMRMDHPEQGVERAQAFDPHVEHDAHSEEARQDQEREP